MTDEKYIQPPVITAALDQANAEIDSILRHAVAALITANPEVAFIAGRSIGLRVRALSDVDAKNVLIVALLRLANLEADARLS